MAGYRTHVPIGEMRMVSGSSYSVAKDARGKNAVVLPFMQERTGRYGETVYNFFGDSEMVTYDDDVYVSPVSRKRGGRRANRTQRKKQRKSKKRMTRKH